MVNGVPAPQGSKRHVGNGRMIENSKAVGPWREAVRAESQRVLLHTLTGRQWLGKAQIGPVEVTIHFWMERPQGHYGTGRNATVLRPSAPVRPACMPDLDKLVRSTLDGLVSGGAIADDKQIVSINAHKWYAVGSRRPGCTLELSEVT